MATEKQLKEDIIQLKDRVAILEKQKEILFNALGVISSSCTEQTIKTSASAQDTLKRLSEDALLALAQAAALTPKKP